MKILLYKPDPKAPWYDRLLEVGIDFASWQCSGEAPHCHAACLVDESTGEVIEAVMGAGVRRRFLDPSELPTLDMMGFEIGPTEAAGVEWLRAQIGKPYATVDLLHFLGRRDDTAPGDSRYFCSMLAAEWRFRAGAPLFDRCQFFKIPPGLIYISPRAFPSPVQTK